MVTRQQVGRVLARIGTRSANVPPRPDWLDRAEQTSADRFRRTYRWDDPEAGGVSSAVVLLDGGRPASVVTVVGLDILDCV